MIIQFYKVENHMFSLGCQRLNLIDEYCYIEKPCLADFFSIPLELRNRLSFINRELNPYLSRYQTEFQQKLLLKYVELPFEISNECVFIKLEENEYCKFTDSVLVYHHLTRHFTNYLKQTATPQVTIYSNPETGIRYDQIKKRFIVNCVSPKQFEINFDTDILETVDYGRDSNDGLLENKSIQATKEGFITIERDPQWVNLNKNVLKEIIIPYKSDSSYYISFLPAKLCFEFDVSKTKWTRRVDYVHSDITIWENSFDNHFQMLYFLHHGIIRRSEEIAFYGGTLSYRTENLELEK